MPPGRNALRAPPHGTIRSAPAGRHPAGPGPANLGSVADEITDGVEALQEATRMLAGVALRSVDVLEGVVSLPQLRVLAVLDDLGRARSARVATALGLEP